MQMCWLLCDENLGRLTDCFLYQELEDAGRQRFAKCDVLPAVFFGENTKVAPKVALSLIHHLNCGSPSLSLGSALFSVLKLFNYIEIVCVRVLCVQKLLMDRRLKSPSKLLVNDENVPVTNTDVSFCFLSFSLVPEILEIFRSRHLLLHLSVPNQFPAAEGPNPEL